jgi:hypothetical protein
MKRTLVILALIVFAVALISSCKKSKPPDVSNLTITGGFDKVTLSWTDPEYDDLALIEVSYDGGSIHIDKGAQQAVLSPLDSGRVYTFTVRTKDSDDQLSDGVSISGFADYRQEYCGDFRFTTIIENWLLGQPTTYDTIVYDGSVSLFHSGDQACPDIVVTAERTLRIDYLSTSFLTPEVMKNGTFIDLYGFHYHHGGSFHGTDTVVFTIDGLGGLGGGTNYSMSGYRLN